MFPGVAFRADHPRLSCGFAGTERQHESAAHFRRPPVSHAIDAAGRAPLDIRTDEPQPEHGRRIMTAPASPASGTGLSQSLNQVLADSYAVMALTHLAHWNVEGQGFFALHTAFQVQYEELFTAIDEIAERIRARGHYAIGGLAQLARTAQLEEFAAPLSQEDYVARLVAANQKLLADAAVARDRAGEENDPESQDLMIARITLHQKTLWMLRSFLKS